MSIIFSAGLIFSLIQIWSIITKTKVRLWQWAFILSSIFLTSFISNLESTPLRGNARMSELGQIYGSDKNDIHNKPHPAIIIETAAKYRKGCFSEHIFFDDGVVYKLQCSNFMERAVPLFRDDYIFLFKGQ